MLMKEIGSSELENHLAQKYPKLVEMARQGRVRLPLSPNGPDAYPRLPSVTPPGTAAEILDWIRGE
jgi:hypothetical protein